MSELFYGDDARRRAGEVFDSVTQFGEYESTYDILDEVSERNDPAQIESILAVQRLAMGSIMPIAQTKLMRGDKANRRHGFSIQSHTGPDNVTPYDGFEEEYMTYHLAKKNFTDWKMLVRFRQNILAEAYRRQSYLEDFAFEWQRGKVLAAAAICRHVVKTDGYTTTDTWHSVRPVSNSEVVDLHSRMRKHVRDSRLDFDRSILNEVA
ncbi:MAG: hypothetical protein EON60_14285 [Alphaproteobacteria bacterium]|nr:MAG: hypothetical protein EON60_14285 [Alphaproteobacteria bacterium]